ncbi:MAG TPA: hydrogenase maturation protease [Pyrinomonadaceae bacterium]|jgi:hydrogenase maturation protease|nr:hydrogenase maturation protease [Pyrinomonadaceae bacterium]
MAEKRILIACIGNIFHGDDGFGVEVARSLAERELRDEIKVVDYGIRGLDLAYALMDGYEVTIFVDAAQRGEKPGTLYVIEPDLTEFENQKPQNAVIDSHGMNPMLVLKMAHSLGAEFKRLLVVGCEPETLGGEEGQMGLSETVQAAVPQAVSLIESLIDKILDGKYFQTAV